MLIIHVIIIIIIIIINWIVQTYTYITDRGAFMRLRFNNYKQITRTIR